MKKLALQLIITLSFLFSPAPREDAKNICGRYVHINTYAGFTLNPDTYGFLLPAITPDSLVMPHAQRQSRPLFILMGTAAGYSLYYISYPFHSWLRTVYKKYWTGAYPEDMLFMLGNFYISFILLNIFILWLSLYLFQKIFILLTWRGDSNSPPRQVWMPGGETSLRPRQKDEPVNGAGRLVMYSLMIFIASNQVTKAFMWTPHFQLFNLLTPLLCVYLALRCNREQCPLSFNRMCFYSLLGGLLLLVYGNFLLLLPVILFCYARNYLLYRAPVSTGGTRAYRMALLIKNLLLLLLLFALPMIVWIYILSLNNTTYYNFEADQYRQLIWIKDTLTQSWATFWSTLVDFTGYYLGTMNDVAVVTIFSISVYVLSRAKLWRKDPDVWSPAFVLLIFFLFYWILGFYQQRLTFSLVPIIICLLTAACKNAWQQNSVHVKISTPVRDRSYGSVEFVIAGFAVCWHLYNLFSYGPFC
jgi:hypothetical protein